MNVISAPQEILSMIFENIPQRYLYECLLVNRCFSINAARQIYLYAINERFFNIPNILNERFIYKEANLSIDGRFAICLVKNFIKCLDDNDKKKLRECDINIHELTNEGSRSMFDYVSLVKKLDLMNLWNMIKFFLLRIDFVSAVENKNYKKFVEREKIFLIFQLLCYLIDRRNPNVIYKLDLSNFPAYEDPEFPCPNEIPDTSHIFARVSQISVGGEVFVEDIFFNNLIQICTNITDIIVNQIKESDFFDYEYITNLIHEQKNLTSLVGVDDEVLNEISESHLSKLTRLFIEFAFEEEANLDGISRCKNLQHLLINAKSDRTDIKVWKEFFIKTQMKDLTSFILLCNKKIVYEIAPFIRTTHNNLRVFHCLITEEYQVVNREKIRILFETIATSCCNLSSFLFTIYSMETINDMKTILISCKKLQELILYSEFWSHGHVSILGKIIPSNLKVLNINNMVYCKHDLHAFLMGCHENGIRNLILDLTDTEYEGNSSGILEILELYIKNGTLLMESSLNDILLQLNIRCLQEELNEFDDV